MAKKSPVVAVSRFFFLPQSETFSVVFAIAMVAITVISLIVDCVHKNDYYLFQRSGALLVLAGVELQYAKLTNSWKSGLDREIAEQPTVQDRLESGKGISMLGEAKALERVRTLAMRLHGLVTEKSAKDVWAVIFAIVGTLIWAYGDLPFRGC